MQRLYIILLLLTTILVGESFKLRPHRSEQFKNDGNITATVDGKVFDLRDANKYTAELKNVSIDNAVFSSQKNDKLTRVTAAFKFYGMDFTDRQGNLYSENITVDYNFGDGALGEPTNQRIVMNYEDQQYYNIPSETKITVTKLEWNADKTSFVMSASFDCLVHRWGMPGNAKQALHLTGKMENVNVTVPASVVNTNPMLTASTK